MRNRLFLPIFILVLIVAACSSSSINRSLGRADKLVFTAPDSAIALLSRIDTGKCSKSQKAHRALLEAKAYSKAHKNSPGLERLIPTVRYYNGDNDSLEMQSKFYYGLALMQSNHSADAIFYLLKAFDLAKQQGDNFYAGLISRNIFFAYQDLYMADSSAVWAPKEKYYFSKTNLPEYINWADATLIEGLINERKYSASLDSIEKVDSVFMKNNPDFRHQIQKFKAYSLGCTGKIQEAVDCYTELLNDGATLDSKEWSGLAEDYILIGDTKTAGACLTNGIKVAQDVTDSVVYWKVKSLLSKKQGNLNDALYYSELWGETLAEDNDKDIINPKISVFSKYLETQLKENEKEIHNKRMWLFVVIGFSGLLIVIFILVICLYRSKQRAKNNEIFYLQQNVDNLNRKLILYEDEIDRIIHADMAGSEVGEKNLLACYARLIDEICDFFYLRMNNDDTRKKLKLTESLRDFLRSIQDGSMMEQLLEYSDHYDGHWRSELKRVCPSLTDKELGILLCERLGLSTNSSLALLNYKTESLYSTRSAAKRKLKSAGLSEDDLKQYLSRI